MTATSKDLISMAPCRLLIVLSKPRRPHQPLAVTSPRRLPPNLTEKLSPRSKSEDEQGTPWQALQACNVGIAFRRVPQADDEVRASSVNTVELGTRWHIIECLYFLSNDGELR